MIKAVIPISRQVGINGYNLKIRMVCFIKLKERPRQVNTSAKLSTCISSLHRIPFIILPLCLQHHLKQKNVTCHFLIPCCLLFMLSLFLRTQEGFITFKFYLVRLEHLLEMSVISEVNIYAEVKKYRQK